MIKDLKIEVTKEPPIRYGKPFAITDKNIHATLRSMKRSLKQGGREDRKK